MRFRGVVLFSLTLLLSAWVAAFAAEGGYQLSVVTDRPEALYSLGEKARFVVTLKGGDQPVADAEVSYRMTKDGVPPVNQGTLKLENGTASIEGTLSEPGFLRCEVEYRVDGKPAARAVGGAGFDPLKIKMSLPVPDDFDAFWTAQKARLAAVPMQPTLTPVASGRDGIEAFDVQITCVPPRPVSGYFARPKGAAPKSLPAILCVQGAGVRSSGLGTAVGQAQKFNALAMDINAHGIPNGQPDEFYKGLNEGELKGYPHFDREDREKGYFVGMFLRLTRALDFLTSQPEWNGKVLVVRGGSQGGGQSIAAAGLDPRVTLISAAVPAICDHSGRVADRANGWPRLVPQGQDGKPDAKVLEAARYVDCVNFATRSKAEAIFCVGFIDNVCAPTSVYAAYNAWPGKKQMINEPLLAHQGSPKLDAVTTAAIQAQIERLK